MVAGLGEGDEVGAEPGVVVVGAGGGGGGHIASLDVYALPCLSLRLVAGTGEEHGSGFLHEGPSLEADGGGEVGAVAVGAEGEAGAVRMDVVVGEDYHALVLSAEGGEDEEGSGAEGVAHGAAGEEVCPLIVGEAVPSLGACVAVVGEHVTMVGGLVGAEVLVLLGGELPFAVNVLQVASGEQHGLGVADAEGIGQRTGGGVAVVAVDDDVVNGDDIGGVDLCVTIDIGLCSGNAAGIALLYVSVDAHHVGGVDLIVVIDIGAAVEGVCIYGEGEVSEARTEVPPP